MRIYLILLLCCGGLTVFAQVGGISAYEFLNLPNSATVAAMGGHHMALMDDDLSLAARNPALLNSQMDRRLALSHAFLPAGISNSYVAFGRHRADLGMTFHAGLQYANYGSDLVRRDNTGADLGTFNAAEAALTVGAARQFDDRFSLGANLKLVNSQLAGYGSFGIALDAGAHYVDTSGLFQVSLLARNFGRQISQYDPSSGREPMPFELQIGLNKELRYLPFRFSFIYRYLDRWNVLYDDPDREEDLLLNLGEEESQRGAGAIFLDNLARHFVVNGELMIGRQRNFRVRFGYNHGMRRELSLSSYRSLAGYSFGFAFRTKRFSLAYGRTTYHLGDGVNQLGVDWRFGEL